MYCTLRKNCIFPKATNNVHIPSKMTSYSYTIIYSVILCHVKLPVYIWKYMEYYKSSVVLLLCRTPKTTTYKKFSRSGMFDRKYSDTRRLPYCLLIKIQLVNGTCIVVV